MLNSKIAKLSSQLKEKDIELEAEKSEMLNKAPKETPVPQDDRESQKQIKIAQGVCVENV
jgi:hypothetical protein